MKGIILSGGSIHDYQKIKSFISDDAIIICADSGYDHAVKMGITPHYVIGDMDSVKNTPKKIPVKKFPVKKDKTDTELAVDLALEKGCDEILILGASGTRLDHTLANIMLLTKLNSLGVFAELADEHNRMTVISKSTKQTAAPNDTISLIPLSDCTGIVTEGLEYPLQNESLEFGNTRGISNRFLYDSATINIASGHLLVIQSKD